MTKFHKKRRQFKFGWVITTEFDQVKWSLEKYNSIASNLLHIYEKKLNYKALVEVRLGLGYIKLFIRMRGKCKSSCHKLLTKFVIKNINGAAYAKIF